MMVWKCPPLHLPNWSNHWKWKQEMNANELADELELRSKYAEDHGTIAKRTAKATTMLRQQADEIAELKNARDYWCLQYKNVFNKLESISNERCNGK